MPSAVKLSDDLVETARRASRLWSRSMTQQIEHWARIGRALERAGDVSSARIRQALTAELDFDDLSVDERAAVLGSVEQMVVRPHGDEQLARALRADALPRATAGPSDSVAMVGPEDATGEP